MQKSSLTEAERLQLIATLRELGDPSYGWRRRLADNIGLLIGNVLRIAVVVGIVYLVQWWTES